MIVIAPYADRDRDRVAALIVGIQRDELGVPITLEDQPDLLDVPGFYGRGDGGFWVARDDDDDDDVVGTIGLLDTGAGAGALRKMFVRADRRGAPHAVAGRLLDALLAHARARGVRVITLGTRPEMSAAHRFYERRGFARIDEAALPASFPRMAVDSVFYQLALA